MKGIKVKKKDLERLLGVDQLTVDDWIKKGAPVYRRLKHSKYRENQNTGYEEWIFNTADVINWLIKKRCSITSTYC